MTTCSSFTLLYMFSRLSKLEIRRVQYYSSINALLLCFFLLCSQKLLKISCFLLQSIGGALFLLRLARAFCLASAAVGLRRRPTSTNGSETRLSSSSGTYSTHKHVLFIHSPPSHFLTVSSAFLRLATLLSPGCSCPSC